MEKFVKEGVSDKTAILAREIYRQSHHRGRNIECLHVRRMGR